LVTGDQDVADTHSTQNRWLPVASIVSPLREAAAVGRLHVPAFTGETPLGARLWLAAHAIRHEQPSATSGAGAFVAKLIQFALILMTEG
jgi:hypothetical protein